MGIFKSPLHKLETRRKSLSSCIALVEEASAAIDILEHQLEAQKDEHKNKFEKQLYNMRRNSIHSVKTQPIIM